MNTPEQSSKIHQAKPVSEYNSNYGVDADPFAYPGDIPEQSYLLIDNQVIEFPTYDATRSSGILGEDLRTFVSGREVTLNELLTSSNQPLLEDRIPMVAYGANQNPRALVEKFTIPDRPDLAIVPAIDATLEDFVPVAHGGPGVRGNVLAELGHLEGAHSNVKVIFLTPEQVLYLHESEQVYEVGVLPDADLTLENGMKLPAIIYAGNAEIYLDAQGRPVGFESIVGSESGIPTLTSEQMLGEMLALDGVIAAITAEVPEFADIAVPGVSITQAYAKLMLQLEITKGSRPKVQKAILKLLEENGHLGTASMSESIIPLSRSLPDTWPTLRAIERGWKIEKTGHLNPDEPFILGRMAVQILGGHSNERDAAIHELSRFFSKQR